jgi:hypothetical protein
MEACLAWSKGCDWNKPPEAQVMSPTAMVTMSLATGVQFFLDVPGPRLSGVRGRSVQWLLPQLHLFTEEHQRMLAEKYLTKA